MAMFRFFDHDLKGRIIFLDLELHCTFQCLSIQLVFSLQQGQKDPNHHSQVPSWWELWGLGLWRAHHNWLNSYSSVHWLYTKYAGTHPSSSQGSQLHKCWSFPRWVQLNLIRRHQSHQLTLLVKYEYIKYTEQTPEAHQNQNSVFLATFSVSLCCYMPCTSY